MSKKRNPFKSLLVILMVLSLTFSGIVFSGRTYAEGLDAKDQEYLRSVMNMIKETYNGEISDELLMEGALKGMFNTMDIYTTYYTKEEAKSFFNDIGGSYEGIGVMVEKSGDYIVVVKVFPNSPAQKAGLLPGDKIASVDGKNVVGASVDETVSLITGPVGTKVKLGIIREGKAGLLELVVERAKIKINPVTYEIRDGIGYIKIETFNSNAYEGIEEALREMDRKGIKKIVLDLRNNPGGEVNQAVAVARKFVPKGLITKLDFKSDSIPDQEYSSYLENPKYKLAVLVNSMTASAAEILAGAVKDTGAGILVGTKTFGKAKVQSLIPILTPEAYAKYSEKLGRNVVNAYDLISAGITPGDDEIIGYAKITTGVYTTPKGRIIDGKGIVPNVVVADNNITEVMSIGKLNKAAKYDLGSESVDVYNAERILMLLGYDVDEPDTKLDPKTYNAVWKFRTDNKLYPGGTLDFTTQEALNRKLDELVLKLDIQYKKAVEVLNKQD